MNERLLKIILFIGVAALHAVLILFLVFNMNTMAQEPEESARVMKLADLEEEPPPPPPPQEEVLPMVEAIAETMIETDEEPVQLVVAPGTLNVNTWDDYVPQFKLSTLPKFDEKEIASSIVYPPIAQRSGIEGRVILELFIDRNGLVQQIRILQENPPERGFGEAAIRAFSGKRAVPAMVNGEPASCRYRWPVSFVLK
jgi:protein TonB